MIYFIDHSQDARGSLVLHLLSYSSQSKGQQGPFLVLWAFDTAPNLLYSNFCHGPDSLSVEYFIEGNTALLRNRIGIPQLQQGIKSSLDNIVRVG